MSNKEVVDSTLLDIISEPVFNSHWSEGKIYPAQLKDFHRQDFFPILGELDRKHITAIIGPRRVGKTTILFQLMSHLLKTGTSSKQILYLKLDEPALHQNTNNVIEDSLSVYSTYVLRKPLDKLTSRIYLFLDEIQYVDSWALSLKSLYDKKYNIKIIISGSSSTDIFEASNPLVGRIHNKMLLSLKFYDFLAYFFRDEKDTSDVIQSFCDVAKEQFRKSLENGNVDVFYKALLTHLIDVKPFKNEIIIRFNEYLIQGGYPALLEYDNYVDRYNELKEAIKLSVLDITQRFSVREDSFIMENLLYLLASETAQKCNYSTLSSSLNKNIKTIISYVNYLENTFLLSRAFKYAKSPAKLIRSEPKIHLNDVGLRNAITGKMNDEILKDRNILGRLIETVVYNHVQQLKSEISGSEDNSIYYTNMNANKEIDMVLSHGNIIVPIESKMGGNDRFSALKKFMKRGDIPLGIVVTENKLDLRDSILFIPAWLFCLLC